MFWGFACQDCMVFQTRLGYRKMYHHKGFARHNYSNWNAKHQMSIFNHVFFCTLFSLSSYPSNFPHFSRFFHPQSSPSVTVTVGSKVGFVYFLTLLGMVVDLLRDFLNAARRRRLERWCYSLLTEGCTRPGKHSTSYNELLKMAIEIV